MPIFCVSDLHLCDRGFRDNFAVEGREARFYKFLDYVEAERGQLYVLGDLFDFWQANMSRAVVAPGVDHLQEGQVRIDAG